MEKDSQSDYSDDDNDDDLRDHTHDQDVHSAQSRHDITPNRRTYKRKRYHHHHQQESTSHIINSSYNESSTAAATATGSGEYESTMAVDNTQTSTPMTINRLPYELAYALLEETKRRGGHGAVRALCTSDPHMLSVCESGREPVYGFTGKQVGDVPRLFYDLSQPKCIFRGLLLGLLHMAPALANTATTVLARYIADLQPGAAASPSNVANYDMMSSFMPAIKAPPDSLSPTILHIWVECQNAVEYERSLQQYAQATWAAYMNPFITLLLSTPPQAGYESINAIHAWYIMAGGALEIAQRLMSKDDTVEQGRHTLYNANKLRRDLFTMQQIQNMYHTQWGRCGIYTMSHTNVILSLALDATKSPRQGDFEQGRIWYVFPTVADVSNALGVDLSARLSMGAQAPSTTFISWTLQQKQIGDSWIQNIIRALGMNDTTYHQIIHWFNSRLRQAVPALFALRPPAWSGYQVPQSIEAFFSLVQFYFVVSHTTGVCLCGRIDAPELPLIIDDDDDDDDTDHSPCAWTFDQRRLWYPPSK